MNDSILRDLFAIIKDRQASPKPGSYTNRLLDAGQDTILKKIGEEAAEVMEKAVELEPGRAEYHDNLGVICTRLGKSDRALACFRAATALEPCAPTTPALRSCSANWLWSRAPPHSRRTSGCWRRTGCLRHLQHLRRGWPPSRPW